MKMVDEVPTEGFFAAVWTHGGHVWSDSYWYRNDTLMIWDEKDTYWNKVDAVPWEHDPCKFVIK